MGIHHSYSQLFEFLSFLVTNDVKKSKSGYHGSLFFKCWNSMLLEPRNALVLHILSAYFILSSMSIHFPEYVVSLWGVQKLLTNLDGNIIPCRTIHIPWMFAALVSWRERCDLKGCSKFFSSIDTAGIYITLQHKIQQEVEFWSLASLLYRGPWSRRIFLFLCISFTWNGSVSFRITQHMHPGKCCYLNFILYIYLLFLWVFVFVPT